MGAGHTDAERHYFGKDYLGSVRAVTNQWGSPLYMFDYDVFGQPLQDRPERFRHGFTGNRKRKLQGKEYDSWTVLYNYGFRDYSAMFGRFTTVDPIQDGRNWYAYVNSDPVSWLDPWGLKPCESQSGGDSKKYTGATGEGVLAVGVVKEMWNDFWNNLTKPKPFDTEKLYSKLEALYYDDGQNTGTLSIQDRNSLPRQYKIKLESHPAAAIGNAMPHGMYTEGNYENQNQKKEVQYKQQGR